MRHYLRNIGYHKIIISIIGCIALFSGVTGCLYAFGVSPSRIELAISAGEVYKGSYEISNTGNKKAVRVSVEVKEWGMDEQGGVIKYDAPEKIDFFTNWLTLSPDKVTIPPNRTKKINYIVSLPKESAGEYRKYLMFKCLPIKKERQGVNIATQISFPFYVVIKGTEVFKAEVSDIKINSAAPLQIEVTVLNSGNVHIRPAGEVTIRKKADSAPLVVLPVNTPPPGWPVLPKEKFRFSLHDSKKLEAGDYVLNAKFRYNNETFSKEVNFSMDDSGVRPTL